MSFTPQVPTPPISTQRRLQRTRWLELIFFLLWVAVIANLLHQPKFLMHQPQLATLIFAVCMSILFLIAYREYRLMDELQRQRFLKVNTAGANTMIFSLALLVYWKTFSWPGHGLAPALRRTVAPITLNLNDLLWPLLSSLILGGLSAAYLYWRDTRGTP